MLLSEEELLSEEDLFHSTLGWVVHKKVYDSGIDDRSTENILTQTNGVEETASQ